MTRDERNRVIARAVVVSIAGAVATYALYLLREVLLTLYISSLLAIGLSPIVRRIERRRLLKGRVRVPRWVAILSLYTGFLLAVALVLALIVPPIVTQVGQLAQDLPARVDRLQRLLVEYNLLNPDWSWESLFSNLQVPGIALTGFFGAVSSAVGAFGKVVTVLILPFYLLLESQSLKSGFLRFFREENRKRADRIARAVTIKVGAWLGGQLLLAAVIGTTATIGFWLIGVPYFYVLGLIAAIGELIPVVGPILAAIPAIALGATVSLQTALITALYCWAQQFVENNVLVPRIMERQVGVSPVTIIVALLVGSTLLGFLGAVLAVPSAAIIQVLVQEYLDREASAEDT